MGNLCLWIFKSGDVVFHLVFLILVTICLSPATVVSNTTTSPPLTSSTIEPSFTSQTVEKTSHFTNRDSSTLILNVTHSVLTTLEPNNTDTLSTSAVLSEIIQTTSNSDFLTANVTSLSATSTVATSKPTDGTDRSTPAANGQMLTSTTPRFGNGSCAGNDTGCPEYRGQDDTNFPTGAIVGIAVGAAVIVIILVSCLVCCCRNRRSLSGSKADLSNYWDDNVTLSYINGHIDFPKDQPDEMISLDNDSFLNSLDNMSFTNVWTADTAKHTNF